MHTILYHLFFILVQHYYLAWNHGTCLTSKAKSTVITQLSITSHICHVPLAIGPHTLIAQHTINKTPTLTECVLATEVGFCSTPISMICSTYDTAFFISVGRIWR